MHHGLLLGGTTSKRTFCICFWSCRLSINVQIVDSVFTHVSMAIRNVRKSLQAYEDGC